jgi:PhnB protein
MERRIAMAVNAVPDGYHSVTPYLIVDGAADAIDFYKKAFGAEEVLRMSMGDRIGHAEIRIGDSILMLSDEWPDFGMLGPKGRGGPTSTMMIYVADCDALFCQAIATGAAEVRPLQDQFYGDRSGTVADPFGHHWTISTHVEDVSEEELRQRLEEMSQSQDG